MTKSRFLAAAVSAAAVLDTPAQGADTGEPTQLGEVQITAPAVASGTAGQGYRVERVRVGPLGEQPLQDTPLSIQVVPAELVRNTQAATTPEALKYVPSVYTNTGASQITPYFTLRGFRASNWTYNMAVDGLRSFDIYEPLEDKERIEVLPGASAFLYGITSPAGMINYVTKRPTAQPVRELTLGLRDRLVYGQADFGGTLAQNPDLAYRVNLAASDTGETGVAHQSEKRRLFSGALDWRINAHNKLALEAAYSRHDVDYTQALFMTAAAIGIPRAPDTTRNWGAPYTYAHDITTRLGAAWESQLSEVFSLRAQVRRSDLERSFRLNRQAWRDASLRYQWRLDSQDPFDVAVDQYALALNADFATGPVRHKLTVSASRDDYEKDFDGARSQTFTRIYPGNLYADPSYPAFAEPRVGASLAQQTTYHTLLLADRLAFGERWELTLGANRASVDDRADSKNVATGLVTRTAYSRSKTTPLVSLSFKPIDALTLYASYLESLQQGVTSSSSGNRGQVFAPFVGKQKEAGAKAALGGFALNLAYFDISQESQTTDPVTQISSQDGLQIHRGWEFSVSGKATPRLTLLGGFTLLDARIDKAAANVGNAPQGVPERLARLYAEYDVPGASGLTLTGGLSYTGKVPWDAANSLFVSPVTLGDLGLRYQMKLGDKPVTWRLGVANVAGKDYWTTRAGILYPGAPRTVSVSASIAL